jgi:hypothetical protein
LGEAAAGEPRVAAVGGVIKDALFGWRGQGDLDRIRGQVGKGRGEGGREVGEEPDVLKLGQNNPGAMGEKLLADPLGGGLPLVIAGEGRGALLSAPDLHSPPGGFGDHGGVEEVTQFIPSLLQRGRGEGSSRKKMFLQAVGKKELEPGIATQSVIEDSG